MFKNTDYLCYSTIFQGFSGSFWKGLCIRKFFKESYFGVITCNMDYTSIMIELPGWYFDYFSNICFTVANLVNYKKFKPILVATSIIYQHEMSTSVIVWSWVAEIYWYQIIILIG